MTDHACLACGEHHTDARDVTLHDGTVVSSYSEAWRHETEARAVLAMPTKLLRSMFLRDVEKARGKSAADALRSLVMVLWEKSVAKQRRAS